MKYFVIMVVNGEYSDQTTTNLFLVETEKVAQQLVEALTTAFEYRLKFSNERQTQFRQEYEAKNPAPARVFNDYPVRYQPQAPEHLRSLPKKERKQFPEYQAFIKALRVFEEESRILQEEHNLQYDIYREQDQQWHEEYLAAEKQMMNEELWPIVKFFFPLEYPTLYKYVYDGYDSRFSWDEIEVI